MRCDEFRDRLQEALSAVDLFSRHRDTISETIDIGTMQRRWRLNAWCSSPPQVEPFHVSASINFRWTPFNAARSYTCEEDLITELLGRRGTPARIERRHVRVDVALRARLPYGSSAFVPAPRPLGSWMASMNERLSASLASAPDEPTPPRDAAVALREPVGIDARCAPDGRLVLDGVSVSAFQIVPVPRIWDDPKRREREPDIGRDLADLAQRFRRGVDAWTDGIAELAASMTHVKPAGPPRPDAEWDPDDDETPTLH